MQKKSWKRQTSLFLTSQGITLLGSSIVQMAMIWYVAMETSSGLWVTLLTLSSCVPQALISPFGGVWADRYSRKGLIILADLAIAVTTLLLALFLRADYAGSALPTIIFVSAVRSLGAGIQVPAVGAVIPQLVPEEHLIRYNGIHGSLMAVVQFAAPAAAGAILSLGTFRWVLYLDVMTAALGIAMLALVAVPRQGFPQPGEGSGIWSELKAGVLFAFTHRLTGRLLFSYGAFIFLCVPSGFLAVLMIQRTFGGHYLYLTVSEMVGFAGMVLGGLLLGAWGGFQNRGKTLMLGFAGYAAFSILLGLTRTFWLFAAAMFLVSLAIPVVQSTVMTVLQETVPGHMQGRVFGLLNVMYTGFMPLGMALFGPMADVIEIQAMVIACGAAILALALLARVTCTAKALKER